MRTRYLGVILFVFVLMAFATDEPVFSTVSAFQKEIGRVEVSLNLSFSDKSYAAKTILIEWPAQSLMLIEPDFESIDYSVEGNKLALFFPENWSRSIEINFDSRSTAPLTGVFNVTMLKSTGDSTSSKPDIVVFEKDIDIPHEITENCDEALPRSLGMTCTPNPFNASVTIQWDLPSDSDSRLAVYDILGKRIVELWSGTKTAGSHTSVWNGTNADNSRASSGIYFVKLDAAGESKIFKIQLIR